MEMVSNDQLILCWNACPCDKVFAPKWLDNLIVILCFLDESNRLGRDPGQLVGLEIRNRSSLIGKCDSKYASVHVEPSREELSRTINLTGRFIEL